MTKRRKQTVALIAMLHNSSDEWLRDFLQGMFKQKLFVPLPVTDFESDLVSIFRVSSDVGHVLFF